MPPREKDMNEYEARFYKNKMKAIRDALDKGDKVRANKHANELMEFFNIR